MSGNRDRLRPSSSSNTGFTLERSSRDAREFARRLERENQRHHEFFKETKSRRRKQSSSDSSSSDREPYVKSFDCYPWTDDPAQVTLEEASRRLNELKILPGYDEFLRRYYWWLNEEATPWYKSADSDLIPIYSDQPQKVLQKFYDFKNGIIRDNPSDATCNLL